MTQTIEKTAPKAERIAMNGVDVPTFTATLGAVDDNRDIAQFTFRANGQWLAGTHSRVTMNGFYGACGEQEREGDHTVEGDHPAVLCGKDNAATPVELLLAALASCLTAGIGNIAAMRQVKLNAVDCTIEGDIDLCGILGLDPNVRNGFAGVRATFRIDGDADAATLEKIVHQSVARSAVFDVLTNGVPVTVEAIAA
ncbi:OsmC family protein [Croceicoccus bisphenolivorans]|uniref:OsmC family protein n=1 Tax=Croceicoccus bisphenolivorans TaxID=1783232 RepID=UPI00083533FB|nr:OsmC family protein [Croceicoccus bisphenolivorans]